MGLGKDDGKSAFFSFKLKRVKDTKDPKFLAETAKDKSQSPVIRIAALDNKNLEDQNTFVKIMTNDEDVEVVIAAINRVERSDALKLIMKNDYYDVSIVEAARNRFIEMYLSIQSVPKKSLNQPKLQRLEKA